MLLKVALNGPRLPGRHPALPLTPEQLASEARQAVAAGAGAIHAHVRSHDQHESLHFDDVAHVVTAIRAACPNVPLGISTGAWIVPDPDRRLALVGDWTIVPDFASVNLDEQGSVELAQLLIARGVGVEAGICDASAAETLVRSGLAATCLRVLIEPDEDDLAAARTNVRQIEVILDRFEVRCSRLLHGTGATAWGLLQDAIVRGYDTRIGLEDTLTLPDGTLATDNAALVAVARQMIAAIGNAPATQGVA